ncbi:MAG TPA: TIGR03435 family protein [Vicinamibacterales bacterium]|jgi:uncharacterized protein (TIGR03435 family)
MRKGLALVFVAIVATGLVLTAAQSPPAGPTFDVVSIKRNAASQAGRFENPINQQRPDGGFTMTRVAVGVLISRAYDPASPGEMVGLPSWAMGEYYDVSATSTLAKATPEDRVAMLRAMLADRFKLVAHFEKREQPVYDLTRARSDGRLGPGMKPSDIDCAPQLEARRAAAAAALAAGAPPPRPELPDFKSPPPSCTVRIVGAPMRDRLGDGQGRLGDLLEGETTVANLAEALQFSNRRRVVDKTGLSGTYHMRMSFADALPGRGGLDIAPDPDAPPSVFTAIREQLGLELESSQAQRDTLIVERLERPTEN